MRNTRNIRNIRNILFVLLAAAAVMACRVYGQVRPPTYAIAAKSGTVANIPVHCIPGYIYFATDATAGSNWYLCTATDTWTQQTGSGVGNIAANSVLGNPTGSPAAAIAITQSTACTTGFTGVSPAICATIMRTDSVDVSATAIPCGGGICPAGEYVLDIYQEVVTCPTSGAGFQAPDTLIDYTSTYGAQELDVSTTPFQTTGVIGGAGTALSAHLSN